MLYRLEPQMTAMDEESLEVYQAAGWDYVTHLAQGFHIFISNCPEPEEIHTDPIAQADTFEKLYQKMKSGMWMLLFGGAPGLLVSIVAMSQLYQTMEQVVSYMHVAVIAYLISFVPYMTYWLVNNYNQVKNLRKKLLAGVPLRHRSPYKVSYANVIVTSIGFVCAVLMLVLPLLKFSYLEECTVAEYTQPLPTILLTEIETNPRLVLEDDYYDDSVKIETTDLADAIIEIRQSGTIAGEMWPDESGEYSTSMTTKVYDLRFSFMADAVMEDIVARNIDFNGSDGFYHQEYWDSPFDRLIIQKEDTSQRLYATAGDKVLYIRYYGTQDLEVHVDALYASLMAM